MIPARKGSKRLPHKNMLKINGEPLIEYSIAAAKQSRYINMIVILSADPQVLQIDSPGVFFEREPEELCQDNTPAMEYIKYIESKYDYDFLVLLQPTSPIRDSADIDKCINIILSDESIDSVVTIRRHLKYLFYPNGNIYVIRRGKDFYNDNMVCVVLDEKKSIDVDTEFNFKVAKMILGDESK